MATAPGRSMTVPMLPAGTAQPPDWSLNDTPVGPQPLDATTGWPAMRRIEVTVTGKLLELATLTMTSADPPGSSAEAGESPTETAMTVTPLRLVASAADPVPPPPPDQNAADTPVIAAA